MNSNANVASLLAAITLIALFAIMADCSKAVSLTSTDAVEACVRSGGKWIGRNDGNLGDINFCQPAEKK